jgi:phosphopantothenoylcysteine synthetase/decarboxylase
MSDKRFLVTAGNTRERIDRVRDWGNIFTGNTGYSIARALAAVGQVDLLTSNAAHLRELELDAAPGVVGFGFRTHADLIEAVERRLRTASYDAVVMTAAVSDYAPERVYEIASRQPGDQPGQERWVVRDVQAGKVGSRHAAIAVRGRPTPKIIDCFRADWAYRGLLIKFKLEVGVATEELVRIGQDSRRASGAEYLVANTLDMVGGPEAGAFLLSDGGREWVPRARLPNRLAELVAGAARRQ